MAARETLAAPLRVVEEVEAPTEVLVVVRPLVPVAPAVIWAAVVAVRAARAEVALAVLEGPAPFTGMLTPTTLDERFPVRISCPNFPSDFPVRFFRPDFPVGFPAKFRIEKRKPKFFSNWKRDREKGPREKRTAGRDMETVGDYYERLFFPIAGPTLLRLATCNGQFELHQREVALEGERPPPLRNALFYSMTEVAETMKRKKAVAIHLGPVFPAHGLCKPYESPALDNELHKPRDIDRARFASGTASPLRQFVIDVDLERDRTCACGTQRQVCDVCWATYMDPAQRVLELLLREWLGFRHFFKVFSGRRGMHYWVVDRRSCLLTNAERASVVEALQRPRPGDPCYDDVVSCLRNGSGNQGDDEALLEMLFPKIDVAVSVDAGHMVKAPLSLHAQTGNLCVLMGAVDGPHRFVPSEDTIHWTEARDVHLRGCVRQIETVLTAASSSSSSGGETEK
jgi:hypothetical protein